jgi:uncharacterized membrane protein
MDSSQQAEARTRMFARVLGPYLVIVTATAMARASQMRTLATEFGANAVWPYVTGAFILLSGLIVVALHQQWRGAAAIIVSVLGWMTTAKGFFLMAFPASYISAVKSAVDAGNWWIVGFTVIGLVGLYLTYVGWIAAPTQPVSEASASSTNGSPPRGGIAHRVHVGARRSPADRRSR